MSDFVKELQHVINCHSKENGSDTPDFILAEYMADCLKAFEVATKSREKWYGREPKPIDPKDWPTTHESPEQKT